MVGMSWRHASGFGRVSDVWFPETRRARQKVGRNANDLAHFRTVCGIYVRGRVNITADSPGCMSGLPLPPRVCATVVDMWLASTH